MNDSRPMSPLGEFLFDTARAINRAHALAIEAPEPCPCCGGPEPECGCDLYVVDGPGEPAACVPPGPITVCDTHQREVR